MWFPWYLLCFLFVLPFLDPRRPLRILHLDVLALVAVGLWPLAILVQGGLIPDAAFVIAVVCLSYLLGRLVWTVFRSGDRRGERLIPVVPVTWLAVALVALVAFRAAYTLTDRVLVIDVGAASVEGANRITEGRPLYANPVGTEVEGGATYGPVVYLAYVPFEQLFPLGELSWRAARPAALTFDLLTMLGLFLLGQRIRPGPEGRELGVVLAYAWAAYPYSMLVLHYSFNDALVSALILAALLAIAYPGRRGALAALAAASKFVPIVLAPLLATGEGDRRPRSILLYTCAFIAVTLAVFLPFIPDGGLSELYDRTIGFQESRTGLMAIWHRAPDLDWLRTALLATLAGASVLFALVPRSRTLAQVAALGAALIVGAQLCGANWFSNYAVWFAPPAFAGLFAGYTLGDARQPHRNDRRPRSVAPGPSK